MKKTMKCHQYATGRGPSGYGFVEYSKDNDGRQEAFAFSLNKWVGLRFTQLPADTDYVLEAAPASTDYLHSGAFMTRTREEAGTSSVYTHVLITQDPPEGAETLGLLKIGNFLTPEQFSKLTHQELTLSVQETDCQLPVDDGSRLNDSQERKLGDFLARFWALLEQKEWSAKGVPELALVLPGMKTEEMIAVFAREVMSRLPRYVRPAVSVSFGAKWNNRGSNPCVCCVLPDNSESPFPCYNINPNENEKNQARDAGPVEKEIAKLLVKGDLSGAPETYLRIEKLANKDDACRNMARGFSVMAYCVVAEQSKNNSIENMRKAYDALCTLAEKRYRIEPERLPYIFVPIIRDTFDLIRKTRQFTVENIDWMLQKSIILRQSEADQGDAEKLAEIDGALKEAFTTLPIDQMSMLLAKKWQDLKEQNLPTGKIVELLEKEEGYLLEKYQSENNPVHVKSAIGQCVRLDHEARENAKELIGGYQAWLCAPDRLEALLNELSDRDMPPVQDETLYFSLLDHAKDSIIKQKALKAATVVSFLKASDLAKEKDPKKTQTIIKKASPSILQWIGTGEKVPESGFPIVAGLILSQPQTKDTINPAFAFAASNSSYAASSAYLEQAIEKIVLSDEADDPEYQETLYHRLTDEDTIVSFLKAANKAKTKNADRAEAVIKNAYPKILDWIDQNKSVSEESFSVITELMLSQPQTKDTIDRVLDFAGSNADYKDSAAFLKRAAEEMIVSESSDDPEYRKKLYDRLKNEDAVVGFLTACDRTGEMNKKRTDTVRENAFPVILDWIEKNRKVSETGFPVLAKLFLSRKPEKETIAPAIDFAISNPDNQEAPAYLKQVTDGMVTSDAAGDPEYQEILFGKLEDAAAADSRFRLDYVIRKLLEKTNNRVVSNEDRTLVLCEKISRARLNECLADFFGKAEAASGEKLGEKWDEQNAKKYSCVWEELSKEDLIKPISDWFGKNYEESGDKIDFLDESWKDASAKENSKYGNALRDVVTEKLAAEYDTVWRNANNGDRREKLDALADRCLPDTSQAAIRKTTAGKARAFQKSLQDLSRTGMDKRPDQAGKLLSTMKNEKGFMKCFRIDRQMEHDPNDQLYQLVILLLQEIQEEPNGCGYWKTPLEELGFDRSVSVWNDSGIRMLNILAYITQSLNDMQTPELGDDLREYLGGEYMNQLWKQSKADQKWFHGSGSSVLSEPLYQWMNK